MMKVSDAYDNRQRECMSRLEFEHPWGMSGGAHALLEQGGFIISTDLETMNSTDKSGTQIPSTGCELSVDMDFINPGEQHMFSTWSIRSQALTIIDGQISLEY